MDSNEVTSLASEYMEALREMPEQSESWETEFMNHMLSGPGVKETLTSLPPELLDRANIGQRLTKIQSVLEQKASIGLKAFAMMDAYFAEKNSQKISPLQAAIWSAHRKRIQDSLLREYASRGTTGTAEGGSKSGCLGAIAICVLGVASFFVW